MKIDWQMYEDGQLGPEAKRAAEEALRSDPASKKELDGLRAFRKTVRESALRAPVPQKSLEKRLSTVVGRAHVPNWRFRFTVAFAVVATVALSYLVTNLPRRSSYELETRKEFASMVDASEWASDFSGLNLTNVRNAEVGQITSAHAIRGWACFDYIVDGTTMHVSIDGGLVSKTGCHLLKVEGGDFYQHKSSHLVSFKQAALVYRIRGGDAETNLTVAKAVFNAVKGT